MTNVEKCIQMIREASRLNGEQYEQKAVEALKFREQNFTREDWEQLVAQTKGPAKYRYAKMMQDKYPD